MTQIHASSSGFSGDEKDEKIMWLRAQLAACQRKSAKRKAVLDKIKSMSFIEWFGYDDGIEIDNLVGKALEDE